MRPDTVVVNHEAPGIPSVLVEGGGDGGGLVELFALGALAPLDDVAILFGTAWPDDLHGHAELLEKFLEGAAEFGADVGLDPRMVTGKVARMGSKACMLRTEGVVTIFVAVSFEIGLQNVS